MSTSKEVPSAPQSSTAKTTKRVSFSAELKNPLRPKSLAKVARSCQPRASDQKGWSLLLERTRARSVVPFVGAGMSCPLLPGWMGLLKKVADRLNCPVAGSCTECGNPGEQLPVLTEILRERLETRWHRSVRAARHMTSSLSSDGKSMHARRPVLERCFD